MESIPPKVDGSFKDICADFTKPLIHTFNKNSSVITGDQPFYNQIVGRTNVILMGDSLGGLLLRYKKSELLHNRGRITHVKKFSFGSTFFVVILTLCSTFSAF